MSEADILYSDVMFTRSRGNTNEIASSSLETTYSEVKILKTQPSTEQQAASQQVVPSRRSKVTSERVSLLVVCLLLTAALISLGVVSFNYFQTKKCLQALKDEYDAKRNDLTAETSLKCEEGWELHGGKCYYFSVTNSSWHQSRDECRHQGGDLVKIDSREEQKFLVERLRTEMKFDEDKFWIGLTDSEQEGTWLWADRSPLDTSLMFWSSREPDNWKGSEGGYDEDCVRMGEKAGADDLKCWFDKLCTTPHRRICEKPGQNGR